MKINPDFAALFDDAVEAWKRGTGDTDAWARIALDGLIGGTLTPEELAQAMYRRLRPRDARGALVSPKVRDGRLSVRNLENTSYPVEGAPSGRKNLETILNLFYDRSLVETEIIEFCQGIGSWRLYGLATLLRKRKNGKTDHFHVSLQSDMIRFIDLLIEEGHYPSRDAVISAAIADFKLKSL